MGLTLSCQNTLIMTSELQAAHQVRKFLHQFMLMGPVSAFVTVDLDLAY
jgi:hypothetical protein